jgi:hypothetical protein
VAAVRSFASIDAPSSEDAATPASISAIYEPVSEEDRERFEEIKALLKSIPTGREALHLMEKYRVIVDFQRGGGTWYNWSSNMMVIDSNKDFIEASFSLVHEMTHASRHHQGMWAHLDAVSRQEYIEQLVEEEAEGDIRAVEAKLELEAIGVPVSAVAAAL